MILVTLGTQDKDFSRLLKAIDKQIKNKKIKEKVIVQSGYTKYESKNMEMFDLIPEEDLERLVKECRILITHGGVGSILLGLKYNKPIIAAARCEKYKEHTNDHQKQILKEFEKDGYLLELKKFDKLDELLEKANKFHPKKYKSNTDKFISNINDYIKNDNHTSFFNKTLNLVGNGYRGIIFNFINVILFLMFINNFSVVASSIISYIIINIFSILFLKFVNIKINKKTYICTQLLILMLDILLPYLLTINNLSNIFIKVISNIITLIISYFILKTILEKNN